MVQLTPPGAIKISVLHGPNLNLLGFRDPDLYGKDDFDQVNKRIKEYAKSIGVDVQIFQSNSEGALIDAIQEARTWAEAIIINAGAYTHYSYAIRDAIADSRLPAIEVHVSNVHAREDFRRLSVIAPVCTGSIAGFGTRSYLLAIEAVKSLIQESHR
jgi:3-dehydroquinate dehydratase-2